MLSVWNADGSLDLGRVADEIDTLIEMQVDGIYSNGTTGEFHAQAEAEFDRISQCLAEKCNAAAMLFHRSPSSRKQRGNSVSKGATNTIKPSHRGFPGFRDGHQTRVPVFAPLTSLTPRLTGQIDCRRKQRKL